MSVPAVRASSASRGERRSHGSLSLLENITLIAHEGDRAALDELHAYRTAFRLNGSRPLLFVEFVRDLCCATMARTLTGNDSAVLERVYDLMIDKYAHLPETDHTIAPTKGNRADCRRSFRLVVDCVAAWKREHAGATPLQVEMEVARTLQKQVVRHFCLACLEARRSLNPARTRYAWHLDHGVLYLWMPTWMRGGQRRVWLEENVAHADPRRPDEQRRVQSIVDDRLGLLRTGTLGEQVKSVCGPRSDGNPLAWLIEQEIAVQGLAKVVADEKAHAISQQRPAIRVLGRLPLRQLIMRIFEDLLEGSYRDGALARTFGLSKATFSRFAGSRWQVCSGDAIPDLWANTAAVLAQHSRFVQVAKEAGVWPQVVRTLRASSQEAPS